MSYGGTREWALWVDHGGPRASTLLGAGYLYSTEQNARKGIDRLVARGELRIDGEGKPRTPLMNDRVYVAKVRP